jgi:hypothetical protein
MFLKMIITLHTNTYCVAGQYYWIASKYFNYIVARSNHVWNVELWSSASMRSPNWTVCSGYHKDTSS